MKDIFNPLAKVFEIIFVSTCGKDVGLQFLIYLYFLSHTFKHVGFKIRNSDSLWKIRLYIAGKCTIKLFLKKISHYRRIMVSWQKYTEFSRVPLSPGPYHHSLREDLGLFNRTKKTIFHGCCCWYYHVSAWFCFGVFGIFWSVITNVRRQYTSICFFLFCFVFFKLGFTPCKAEQPLRGMELQEKKHKKDYRIQKICLQRT